MILLDDHIKILGSLIGLIIGSGVIVYAYQLVKIYSFNYLKQILKYLILYNVFILLSLVIKYLDLNVFKSITTDIFSWKFNIFFISIIVSGHSLNYILIKIFLEFRERYFSKGVNQFFFRFFIILMTLIGVFLIFDTSFLSEKSAITFRVLLFLSVFFVEFLILLVHLFVRMRSILKENNWLYKSFGLLLTLKYWFLISLILFLPEIKSLPPFYKGIFASIIYILFNVLIFIWLKFIFKKRVKTILNILDADKVLEPLLQKYKISKREKDIVELKKKKKNNKEIEEKLFISYHTVKNHIYNIFQKFKVKNRYELINLIMDHQKSVQEGGADK